jgi:hypothetical protein
LAPDFGDIGYIDSSGMWRKTMNVFDEVECRAHGISPLLLERERTKYFRQGILMSGEQPIVKLSRGWEVNFLDSAELQM